MDWLDVLGLLLLGALAWLWLDSLKARVAAVAACKALCAAEQLLLLDDTVAIRAVALERDDDGVLRLRRRYGFEYTDSGDSRLAGRVIMLGARVLLINLERPPVAPSAWLH